MPKTLRFCIASTILAATAFILFAAGAASAGAIKLQCNEHAITQARVEHSNGVTTWLWCDPGEKTRRYGIPISADFDVTLWMWTVDGPWQSKECTVSGGPWTASVSRHCKDGKAYSKVMVLTDLYFDFFD